VSPAAALELRSLSKRFGSKEVVTDISFRVEHGEVFGFLGPNGAGKTTTMRMVLGLVRPSSGQLLVLGEETPAGGRRVLPQVGPLVEVPALYPNLSGRDNLAVLGAELGGVPRSRVEELLATVGLADRSRDRVSCYFLGMRQRLGLAVALLHRPRLLLLDEPANGLDPAGIREIRSLLRNLSSAGTTIFISSQVLGEMERVCDRVALLRRGRLVYLGALSSLRASTGTFWVRLDRPEEALRWLKDQPWGASAQAAPDGMVEVVSPTGRGRDLNLALMEAGFVADSLVPCERDLEEAFLQLTEDEP
jgi:ABC-type multidrug transport system ATPase subunit